MNDLRINMLEKDFLSISKYEDETYLTFYFSEKLMRPLYSKMDTWENFLMVYDSMTMGQKILYSITELQKEVLNGGLAQFFWNKPVEAHETNLCLKTIGETSIQPLYEKYVLEWILNDEEFDKYRSDEDFESYANLLNAKDFDILMIEKSIQIELQKLLLNYVLENAHMFIISK